MRKISLNGSWKIRWSDGQRGGMPHFLKSEGDTASTYLKFLPREIDETSYSAYEWMDASVPGEIHLDLMRLGVISSIYEGTGVMQARWVEECFWYYRREFDGSDIHMNESIKLKFESLELTVRIFLNGKEIGSHNNAFRPCSIDITGMVVAGINVLSVQLESGLYHVSEKAVSGYYNATMSPDILLHKRNWLRKTQSQMSWDWSPRLMNVGITGDVSIYTGDLIVENLFISSYLSENLTKGSILVRLDLDYADKPQEVRLSVKAFGAEHIKVFSGAEISNMLEFSIKVENPDLWWPVGYGSQKLYTIDVHLSGAGKTIYQAVKKVGFRRVDIDQSPHPIEGNYFIFRINNTDIFMKGSNLVPLDLVPLPLVEERYDKLIELALEANFNFLRVWGGGLYETDYFYELCDEAGIMVWQEFISACAVIPAADPELYENIQQEALYQIRRLSSHPSLIAWCGNNEVGWFCNSSKELNCGEDDILYNDLFPRLLQEEDPEKYYQPTSPYSADHDDFNYPTTGDQHPWTVGFQDKDSRKYEEMVCRFPNEGGILGPTSPESMMKSFALGDDYYMSHSWQVHDNMLAFQSAGTSPDKDLEFWTGLDIRSLALEDYIYLGGVVQGEGLKRYIENFRRRKFSSSGAVFWMYNDIWPAVRSWSIVDYYLNRIPAYYHVKRAFQEISPVLAFEDGKINIYGVNDTLENQDLDLSWGAFTAKGKELFSRKKQITLAPNTSSLLEKIDDKYLSLPDSSKEEPVFYAEIYKENKLLARSRYTPRKFNELGLKKAHIKLTKDSDGYIFESDVFALGVSIDLDGRVSLSDNYFDLYPNRPYKVFCPPDFDPSEPICMNDFLGLAKME